MTKGSASKLWSAHACAARCQAWHADVNVNVMLRVCVTKTVTYASDNASSALNSHARPYEYTTGTEYDDHEFKHEYFETWTFHWNTISTSDTNLFIS